eukprot:403373925
MQETQKQSNLQKNIQRVLNEVENDTLTFDEIWAEYQKLFGSVRCQGFKCSLLSLVRRGIVQYDKMTQRYSANILYVDDANEDDLGRVAISTSLIHIEQSSQDEISETQATNYFMNFLGNLRLQTEVRNSESCQPLKSSKRRSRRVRTTDQEIQTEEFSLQCFNCDSILDVTQLNQIYDMSESENSRIENEGQGEEQDCDDADSKLSSSDLSQDSVGSTYDCSDYYRAQLRLEQISQIQGKLFLGGNKSIPTRQSHNTRAKCQMNQ